MGKNVFSINFIGGSPGSGIVISAIIECIQNLLESLLMFKEVSYFLEQ